MQFSVKLNTKNHPSPLRLNMIKWGVSKRDPQVTMGSNTKSWSFMTWTIGGYPYDWGNSSSSSICIETQHDSTSKKWSKSLTWSWSADLPSSSIARSMLISQSRLMDEFWGCHHLRTPSALTWWGRAAWEDGVLAARQLSRDVQGKPWAIHRYDMIFFWEFSGNYTSIRHNAYQCMIMLVSV